MHDINSRRDLESLEASEASEAWCMHLSISWPINSLSKRQDADLRDIRAAHTCHMLLYFIQVGMALGLGDKAITKFVG